MVRADDLGDNVMASGFPGAVARSIPGECGFIGPPAAVGIMELDDLAFVAGVDCRPGNRQDVLRAGRRLRAEVKGFDPDVVLLPQFGFRTRGARDRARGTTSAPHGHLGPGRHAEAPPPRLVAPAAARPPTVSRRGSAPRVRAPSALRRVHRRRSGRHRPGARRPRRSRHPSSTDDRDRSSPSPSGRPRGVGGGPSNGTQR